MWIRCSNTLKCGIPLAPRTCKVSRQPVTTTSQHLAAHWKSADVSTWPADVFFIEPQAQLAEVWERGTDYTASNGLRVHGDDQTSLQGRLGGRLGMHFELSQGRAIEPHAKAEVIEEFLTGNSVTTNSTTFGSNLSGTVGRFGGGLTVRLSQAVYLYGEYDYATGDHFQQPWSVNAGLRWQW
jgi:outer membrane autotransporter protein